MSSPTQYTLTAAALVGEFLKVKQNANATIILIMLCKHFQRDAACKHTFGREIDFDFLMEFHNLIYNGDVPDIYDLCSLAVILKGVYRSTTDLKELFKLENVEKAKAKEAKAREAKAKEAKAKEAKAKEEESDEEEEEESEEEEDEEDEGLPCPSDVGPMPIQLNGDFDDFEDFEEDSKEEEEWWILPAKKEKAKAEEEEEAEEEGPKCEECKNSLRWVGADCPNCF